MSKLDKIPKEKVVISQDELTNKNVVHIDGKEIEFSEVVVKMGRVTKVVKGGRRFSFNAISVIGDKDCYVGFGFGKAQEIVEAIRKSVEKAKKNIIRVKVRGTTIPHEVKGKFKSTVVLLKPCSPGTGIIAGNAVRSVVELGGIKDILTKVQGSTNPLNIVKATFIGLSQLITVEEAKMYRNINVKQLFGEYSLERHKQKSSLKEDAVIEKADDSQQTPSLEEVKQEQLGDDIPAIDAIETKKEEESVFSSNVEDNQQDNTEEAGDQKSTTTNKEVIENS